MTGFGQARREADGRVATCEIRSVNNRFADARIKLPPDMLGQEARWRAAVLARVGRGRVDVTLRLSPAADRPATLRLNEPLVDSLLDAAKQLGSRYGVDGQPEVGRLLAVPGLLQADESPAGAGAEELALCDAALSEALEALDREKLREGERLREDLVVRLRTMREIVGKIERRAPDVPAEPKRKLLERLEQLGQGVDLDPSRVAQEAVFLADRADVTEELLRLRTHLEQASALLDRPDGEPVGKRLDFLMQEVHRETNTINAKSSDLDVTGLALEMKAEGEKVREQIQNLE